MKDVSTARDLFFDQLRDLHSMESQISLTLPILAATAAHEDLRSLLLRHADETDRHFQTVVEIFARHGREPGNDKCKAIAGLIEGGDAHLATASKPATRDLMMIAHCLRIEHYEIAAYEITTRLAERLGLDAEALALSHLLAEEDRVIQELLELEPLIFQSSNS